MSPTFNCFECCPQIYTKFLSLTPIVHLLDNSIFIFIPFNDNNKSTSLLASNLLFLFNFLLNIFKFPITSLIGISKYIDIKSSNIHIFSSLLKS